MPYAVIADLESEFGDTELIQLCDRTGSGALDAAAQAVAQRAIDRAGEEIDSYIAQRYSLPLSAVPTSLLGRACDIARFYLYDARAPKIVQDRYNNAVSWLKDIAANRATLGDDASGNEIAASEGAVLAVVASDQVFTDDLLALQ